MPTNADGEYKRTNGFERPFDKLQLLAWLICSYMILSYFLIVLPLQSGGTRVWATIVYTILLSVFAFLAYYTGGVDPVDSTTKRTLQNTPRDLQSCDLLYCCFCKCKVHAKDALAPPCARERSGAKLANFAAALALAEEMKVPANAALDALKM